jgi:hypothetical protein
MAFGHLSTCKYDFLLLLPLDRPGRIDMPGMNRVFFSGLVIVSRQYLATNINNISQVTE